MSRLDELIAELCPDGVECKRLINICSEIIVPMRDRPKVFDGNIPWCRIEDKEGQYFHRSLSGLGVSEKTIKSMNLKVFPKGTVICSCSASLGAYAINTQPLVTNQTFLGLVCSNSIYNKYLLYYMETQTDKLKSLASTGTVPYISRRKFEELVVPVPPLPVQQEIVRILDKFTALEARKKQYEYYLDQILSYEGRDDVRWMMLGEVCTVTDNINWRESQEKYKYIDLTSVSRDTHKITETIMIDKSTAPSRAQKLLKKDDIIFATTRPTLRRFAIITDEYDGQVCSTGFCVLRANQKDVLPKWIYYNIAKTDFYIYMESVQKGSAYPAVSDSDVKKYKIPIPPLVEQERIVAILDRFDALVNDITQGLPAEIAARRKQYEYYRDKLLTFKEKVS